MFEEIRLIFSLYVDLWTAMKCTGEQNEGLSWGQGRLRWKIIQLHFLYFFDESLSINMSKLLLSHERTEQQ